MSVSKKHKEVNTGLTNLMTHMKNDYHNWSMTGRTVHQNTEDFIRESKIREDMEERYCDGLGYDVNTKYIKVFSDAGFGDILKPAGWRGPTRNFARGNILENDFHGVHWTGC